MPPVRTLIVATAAALGVITTAPALAATRGPSTGTEPYVSGVGAGVTTKALLTAGDRVGGYRYVGVPDGLGAVRAAGSRSITVFSNHELGPTAGVVRAHGQTGAFVSRLTLNRATDAVTAAADLIRPGVRYYDYVGRTFGPAPGPGGANPLDPTDTFPALSAAFSRFCSGSLTPERTLLNPRSRRGYRGQIYFANEEGSDEGRVFGVTTGGVTRQLPRLGQYSMENNVLSPARNTDATVVIGNEDGPAGASQLSVYKGAKTARGDAFDRAGLTNGTHFVIDAANAAVTTDAQWRSTYGKGVAAAVKLNRISWDQSGTQQNRQALTDGLGLTRIEDGAFDPKRPNTYYFLTTEGGSTTDNPDEPGAITRDGGGLWRLVFDDVRRPERGGRLTLLLDGSEAPYLSKPDNMDIDGNGNMLIQEDSGNNAHVGRIVAYRLRDGRRGVVAAFNDAQFKPGGANFLTQDEESSGIIDATKLYGAGYWLFDAQVHMASGDAETVEPGQLLKLRIPDFRAVYTIR